MEAHEEIGQSNPSSAWPGSRSAFVVLIKEGWRGGGRSGVGEEVGGWQGCSGGSWGWGSLVAT